MATIHSPDGTGLDSINPATYPGQDAVRFRAIRAAAKNIETAEQELHDAVLAAREAGGSWAIISSAPGISRQAAQQRCLGDDGPGVSSGGGEHHARAPAAVRGLTGAKTFV